MTNKPLVSCLHDSRTINLCNAHGHSQAANLFTLLENEMGREVRKVPARWEHPKTTLGYYIPLEMYSAEKIADLVNSGELDAEAPFYGYKAMPLWSEEECSHFQMYECTSEGTPISPPMPTKESLAEWLENNNANAGGGMTATKEQWLRMINVGFAPTMVVKNGVFQPGVRL